MKLLNIYSRLLILMMLIGVINNSCKKSFLEITPKGKLIATTKDDYQKLLNNAEVFLTADAQVPLGDEVAAVDPYFQGVDFGFPQYVPLRNQRLFRYEDVVYEPEQDGAEMTYTMPTIYLYNKVINEVMNSTGGTEQEKKTIQAEAKASRAWTYFLLINYYGLPYNEATSSSDPGFPIITKADVTANEFTRASVKEVYDFIVDDLTTSIPDLPAQTSHRYIMSRPAAQGLLGKVYMFMGKFAEALPLLDAAIDGAQTSAIPLHLYNYNETLAPGGSFQPIGIFGPTYPRDNNIEESMYSKFFLNFWAFITSEFPISPQTVALYKSSDLRLNFYTNLPYGQSDPYPLGMLKRQGPIIADFGICLPDMYLLRAECKARLSDLGGAKNDVETLRENRMPPADAVVAGNIASDQVALVKFILDERIREFAVQGYRWFDMRRLSVDPVYSSTVNYTHTLYNLSGGSTTFTLRPERFALRFAQKLINQNPGMDNNP